MQNLSATVGVDSGNLSNILLQLSLIIIRAKEAIYLLIIIWLRICDYENKRVIVKKKKFKITINKITNTT